MVSECERDLGVFVSSDLKWNIHVSYIASKANKVLGMLVKNARFKGAIPTRLKDLHIRKGLRYGVLHLGGTKEKRRPNADL